MSAKKSITVLAPATIANVASGFDILGFAVSTVADQITATETDTPGVQIEVEGLTLPNDPTKNTGGVPVLKMLADHAPKAGIKIKIKKGIPLGSGMGGSAASAVGAAVAANLALNLGLTQEQLLRYALEGEAVASGSKHSDNIAPCLYGGLTLTRPGDLPEVVRLPYPREMYCALVHPSIVINTRDARSVLRHEITLHEHSAQSARLAALIAGCCTGDFELIHKGLDDILVEPQRATLIPGFYDVKQAALAAGALGCSISGAGPSVFALTRDASTAGTVRDKMIAAFEAHGLKAQGWTSPILAVGAGPA